MAQGARFQMLCQQSLLLSTLNMLCEVVVTVRQMLLLPPHELHDWDPLLTDHPKQDCSPACLPAL